MQQLIETLFGNPEVSIQLKGNGALLWWLLQTAPWTILFLLISSVIAWRLLKIK